jgi:GNAT superfamily N-acetyltransferase
MARMLEIREVCDEAELRDWLHVHNVIVPSAAMSLEEASERTGVYFREVAYLDGELVACTTVRPPAEGVATVIVRVLPEFRSRGYGTELYDRAVEQASRLGADTVATIVWESNVEGLAFAAKCGFVETGRIESDFIRLVRC